MYTVRILFCQESCLNSWNRQITMAAEVLEVSNEQLRCTLCLGTYTNPKVLHCLHIYCQQCLVPLVAQDEQGPPGIACPTCHEKTPVPEGGVAELPSAFSLHQVKEEDANKQVTDKHLDEISRTCCRKWKSLRPHLEMEEIVEHNISKGPGDEEEKRRSFFFQWKDVMALTKC